MSRGKRIQFQLIIFDKEFYIKAAEISTESFSSFGLSSHVDCKNDTNNNFRSTGCAINSDCNT